MNDAPPEFFTSRTWQPPPDEDKAPPSSRIGCKMPTLTIFDVGDKAGNIAPRQWLLGTVFCRGTLSGLISAGAAGKTTFRILQAVSVAANRSLTGDHVHTRCRVLIICWKMTS